ncbi:MAG TPA: CHASE4 domain-containing protein, partial [Dehalococcoidales bacterium]|nr:CHASE4 domain-containing protein [Dehalococcoidales bacterium]
MRLIYTTTLITLAVMVTFSLATSLFSTRHIQRSYESLEDNIALNNLGRVNYAIADRLAALEKTAADWGIWDDTYNFIQTGDQSYIDLNLSQEYFTRMNLGLIAFFDTSNQMVFYLSLDTETEQMMELRSEDLSELQRFIPVSLESHKIKNSGIISLYDRLMLVTSHPILRSDNRGPASGTILKGTWLDERLVNEIAHSTRLNFTILPFSPTELRGLSGESLHPLVSGGQTLIVKPDIRTLNAYELVNDYKNNPVLINQISEPRDAYAQGRQVIAWWNTVLLALAIIFVGMLIILIYLLIIRRLQRLT